MKLTMIILLILALHACVTNSAFKPAQRRNRTYPTPFPKFQVVHNATPRQKWEKPLQQHKKEFADFVEALMGMLERSRFLNKLLISEIKNLKTNKNANQDMVEEIEVISQISGIPFEQIALVNHVYEMFSQQKACSSILIQNPDGNILHGRNLDYFLQKQYAKIQIQFDYLDSNGNIYVSTSQYVGYIVTHTGVKHNKFSISLNQRAKGTGSESLNQFMHGAYSDVYLIQKVLMECNSYSEALKVLKTTPLIAPVYYIVSGVNKYEGALIERNRDSVHAEYYLSEKNWYIVATNIDADQKDNDTRRTVATQRVVQLGRQATNGQLKFDILEQYPNFNRSTLSITMMNARLNYIQSTNYY